MKNNAWAALVILILTALLWGYAAYAEIDGTDYARRQAAYTFTQFSPADTTETVSLFDGNTRIVYQITIGSVTDTVKIVPQVSVDGTSWMDAYLDTLTYTANGTEGFVIGNMTVHPYSRIVAHGDTGATIDIVVRPGD